ncbi:MAG: signal peptidase II [Gammaproteobacteria bacterium]|nr:MAG: signal peptidase II [Gammaproteobacteria bacterium]
MPNDKPNNNGLNIKMSHSDTVLNGNQAFKWYLISVFVLVTDQASKVFFENLLDLHETIPVIEPILNWTLKYNYGAAFSFLADQNGWQKWFFAGLSLAVSLFLLWYIRKVPRNAKVLSFAMALILGGAVGNLIDRILYGHVIDFIHVHYADVWHYPVFNIADCGIVIGVMLMVYDMLFLESKRQ